MVVVVLILEEAVCGETVDACGTTARRLDGDLEAASEGGVSATWAGRKCEGEVGRIGEGCGRQERFRKEGIRGSRGAMRGGRWERPQTLDLSKIFKR